MLWLFFCSGPPNSENDFPADGVGPDIVDLPGILGELDRGNDYKRSGTLGREIL